VSWCRHCWVLSWRGVCWLERNGRSWCWTRRFLRRSKRRGRKGWRARRRLRCRWNLRRVVCWRLFKRGQCRWRSCWQGRWVWRRHGRRCVGKSGQGCGQGAWLCSWLVRVTRHRGLKRRGNVVGCKGRSSRDRRHRFRRKVRRWLLNRWLHARRVSWSVRVASRSRVICRLDVVGRVRGLVRRSVGIYNSVKDEIGAIFSVRRVSSWLSFRRVQGGRNVRHVESGHSARLHRGELRRWLGCGLVTGMIARPVRRLLGRVRARRMHRRVLSRLVRGVFRGLVRGKFARIVTGCRGRLLSWLHRWVKRRLRWLFRRCRRWSSWLHGRVRCRHGIRRPRWIGRRTSWGKGRLGRGRWLWRLGDCWLLGRSYTRFLGRISRRLERRMVRRQSRGLGTWLKCGRQRCRLV